MILKDFRIIYLLLLSNFVLYGQNQVAGVVVEKLTETPIQSVEIFSGSGKLLATTNFKGTYVFQVEQDSIDLIYFSYNYKPLKIAVNASKGLNLNIKLEPLTEQLSSVELAVVKKKYFSVKRLADVEEMAIYAGKKNEVVVMDNIFANLATNNARQIYSQIAGLNIYQNDDAGLQLNIGGRGLDPNRTSNFNTRQNGYDISADVLGYPESYYTPPAESLSEIQIIRGAASLQYGTQFGGLVNFKMKDPNPNRLLEVQTQNTVGSNNLYTNFTSLSGTKNKLSYYAFFNYKRGDGFRDNSEFESRNTYFKSIYKPSEKTEISAELTYLSYLAQQAGGLNDVMFNNKPYQSNRSRNWFAIDWLLYNAKITHEFSDRTKFSFNFFGLDATRKALGFRSNRVDQVDSFEARDLIKGDFRNYGFESRLLHNYKLLNKNSTALLGLKFYKANNNGQQGPGSNGYGPDFSFQTAQYIDYPAQSDYTYPNLNTAVFGEQLIYLNDVFSITPGFRFEYIKTESQGYSKTIRLDAAGNTILNETNYEDEQRERSFVLLGIGASYKPTVFLEFYGNISQNYRSVTFADISIINPAFVINPEITDEKGYTMDVGARGVFKKLISYDISLFSLLYEDRIGFVQKVFPDGNVRSERGNIGEARIFGFESLVDFNLNKLFSLGSKIQSNLFFNTSFIDSKYTASQANGIVGNRVEFVPRVNFKTGFKFSYNDFTTSLQYSYISEQFTDATNAKESNLSGVIGAIPAYDILDIGCSYSLGDFTFDAGVNNLLDNAYFTRRATGYPGPGIIPSPPQNVYLTVGLKF
jgi:Fe(3+) dicitrate transport protein|tara:strand:+ start:4464 stop:6890 length:2427 start_codon:yes stop_codon:yes gene_type:complete